MSGLNGRPLLEQAALALQSLYRERPRGEWNTLVRIDAREEAEEAPYRFDPVHGLLHRKDCYAIPKDARSASYGLWRVEPAGGIRTCQRCKPMPEEKASEEKGSPETKAGPDLLFGLVSLLDQFGAVLKERGKDYRKTEAGRKIGTELAHFYQALSRRERETVDTVLASLELLTGRMREAEEEVKSTRGSKRG